VKWHAPGFEAGRVIWINRKRTARSNFWKSGTCCAGFAMFGAFRRQSPNGFEKARGFASIYWYNLFEKESLEVFKDAAT